MADEGMSGIGFNANFSETGDAKRLIADIQQLIAVVSQLGTASELTSKKFPQLLNQISRGAGGAFTPHITGLRDLYKTYPTPSPERSAAYASWQSGVAGSSADISDAAYNKYITGQNWSRFSGINLVPANIRAGAMGGLQRETNTGTWRSIAGSKLYNPQNENPLSRSAFMQQGAAYNNALGAIGNLGLTAGSIQENTSRYQLGQRSAERISKMRNDLAAWQVENENLTNNEIRSIWRKTNSQRIANEQKIAAQQQATFNQQASAQAGFSRMGFGPNQAAQMAARGQVPLTDGSMNLFGRTAVSMAALYGLQQQFRTTINLARTLEVDVARIRGITDLPGQGSPASGVGMRNDIMRISRKTGTPLTDVANSFEEVFQAGSMPTRDAANIVELIAKMSRTSRAQGFTPTQADTSALTTILMAGRNSFNLKGPDMNRFGSMLFELRKRGVIEYPAISTSFGKVAQAGALSGFSGLNGENGLQGLLALATGVTKGGGNPSYNETMLARLLTEISKPKTMGKLEGLGIRVSATNPMQTLNQLMAREMESRAAGKGSFIQQSGIFTRDLGSRGASILAQQWPEVQKQIRETTGDVTSLDDAFSTLFETTSEKLERLTRSADSFRALWGEDILNAINSVITPMTDLVALIDKIDVKKHPAAAGLGAAIRVGAEGAITYGTLGLGATVASQLLGVGALRGFAGTSKLGSTALGSNLQSLFYGLTGNAQGMEKLAQQQLLSQNIAMYRRAAGGFGEAETINVAGKQALKAAGLNKAAIAETAAASARGGSAIFAAGGSAGAGAVGYAAVAVLIYEALSTGYNAWVQAAQAKTAESIRNLEDQLQISHNIGQSVATGRGTLRDIKSGRISAEEGKIALIRQLNEFAGTEPNAAAGVGLVTKDGVLTLNGQQITGSTSMAQVLAASALRDKANKTQLTNSLTQSYYTNQESIKNLTPNVTHDMVISTLLQSMGLGTHPGLQGKTLNEFKNIQKIYDDARKKAKEEFSGFDLTQVKGLAPDSIDIDAWNKQISATEDYMRTFEGSAGIRARISGFTPSQQALSDKYANQQELLQQYQKLFSVGTDPGEIIAKLKNDNPDIYSAFEGATNQFTATKKQYDTMTARKGILENLEKELQSIHAQAETQQRVEGLTDEQAKAREDNLREQTFIKTKMQLEATGQDAIAGLTESMQTEMAESVNHASEVNKHMAEISLSMQKLTGTSASLDDALQVATNKIQFAQAFDKARNASLGQFATLFSQSYHGKQGEIQPIADIMVKARLAGAEMTSGFESLGGNIQSYNLSLTAIDKKRKISEKTRNRKLADLELKKATMTPQEYLSAKDAIEQAHDPKQFDNMELSAKQQLSRSTAPIASSMFDMLGQAQQLRSYIADHEFDRKNVPAVQELLKSKLGQNDMLRNPLGFYEQMTGKFGDQYNALVALSPEWQGIDKAFKTLKGSFKSTQEAQHTPLTDPRMQDFMSSIFESMGAGKDGDLLGAIKSITDRWGNIDADTMYRIETGFDSVQTALDELVANITQVAERMLNSDNAAGILADHGQFDPGYKPGATLNSMGLPSGDGLGVPGKTSSAVQYMFKKRYGIGDAIYDANGKRIRHHGSKGWHDHMGADILAPEGTEIYATHAGVIKYTSNADDAGNLARITQSDGNYQRYLHMQKFAPNVLNGDQVNVSDLIGYVGHTSGGKNNNMNNIGPHLHYEEYVDGKVNLTLAQSLKNYALPGTQNIAPAANEASGSMINLASQALAAAQALGALAGAKISGRGANIGGIGFWGGSSTMPTSRNPYVGGQSVSLASGGKFTWGPFAKRKVNPLGYFAGAAAPAASGVGPSGYSPAVTNNASNLYWCEDCGGWRLSNDDSYLDTSHGKGDLAGAQSALPSQAGIDSGDLSGYGPLNVAGDSGGQNTNKQEKQKQFGIGDALTGAVAGSLDTFFAALAQGGTIKEALDAAWQSFSQTLAQGVSQAIQVAMPGPGGAIAGSLIGGLIGWGLSRIFHKSTPERDRPHVNATIENWPDALKHWTLPSSAYYHPADFSRAGSVVQNNNNIFHMPDGPGMTSRVQRAVSETAYLSQLQRGLV